MKKLSLAISLACMGLVGVSGNVLADKPTEALLYHCGCEAFDEGDVGATSDLVWKEIIVSSKSKGHRRHLADDEENCTYEDEFYVTQDNFLTRGFNDLQDEGNDPALLGVDTCESGVDCPTAGDSCRFVPEV